MNTIDDLNKQLIQLKTDVAPILVCARKAAELADNCGKQKLENVVVEIINDFESKYYYIAEMADAIEDDIFK